MCLIFPSIFGHNLPWKVSYKISVCCNQGPNCYRFLLEKPWLTHHVQCICVDTHRPSHAAVHGRVGSSSLHWHGSISGWGGRGQATLSFYYSLSTLGLWNHRVYLGNCQIIQNHKIQSRIFIGVLLTPRFRENQMLLSLMFANMLYF